MLTDLIACTSSTYTQTEIEEITESKECIRGKGKRVVGTSNSNSSGNSHSVVLGLGDEIGEELLLNAIAGCTNITFYACKVSTSVHVLTH